MNKPSQENSSKGFKRFLSFKIFLPLLVAVTLLGVIVVLIQMDAVEVRHVRTIKPSPGQRNLRTLKKDADKACKDACLRKRLNEYKKQLKTVAEDNRQLQKKFNDTLTHLRNCVKSKKAIRFQLSQTKQDVGVGKLTENKPPISQNVPSEFDPAPNQRAVRVFDKGGKKQFKFHEAEQPEIKAISEDKSAASNRTIHSKSRNETEDVKNNSATAVHRRDSVVSWQTSPDTKPVLNFDKKNGLQANSTGYNKDSTLEDTTNSDFVAEKLNRTEALPLNQDHLRTVNNSVQAKR